MPLASIILALIQAAPGAITEISALVAAVKGDLSATDQATIDQALANAQVRDATATKAADDALTDASQR